MAEDNVHVLDVITRLDIPVERVLKAATDAKLIEVVIIGFRDDGSEFFSSSLADGGDVLWHLGRATHKLLSQVDE